MNASERTAARRVALARAARLRAKRSRADARRAAAGSVGQKTSPCRCPSPKMSKPRDRRTIKVLLPVTPCKGAHTGGTALKTSAELLEKLKTGAGGGLQIDQTRGKRSTCWQL